MAAKRNNLATTSPLDALRDDPDQIREMSFEELARAAKEAGELADAGEIGSGYHLIQSASEKKFLVGQAFIIVDFQVNKSNKVRVEDPLDPRGYFATAQIKTEHPIRALGNHDMFILNDGGTGIYRQLLDYKSRGKLNMILCRNGLRASEEYEVTEPVFDSDTGAPVFDEITGKQKTRPRIDPITNAVMTGTTYYLDDSV